MTYNFVSCTFPPPETRSEYDNRIGMKILIHAWWYLYATRKPTDLQLAERRLIAHLMDAIRRTSFEKK
jgi:hypothetical protein